MDYHRENGFSSGNVVQVLAGNNGNRFNENWCLESTDQVVWATEDEYGMWNNEAFIDIEARLSQSRSGDEPPNTRSRNSQLGDIMASNRSKAIGKMFYKTKLCCKFRAGTCPLILHIVLRNLGNHPLIGKKLWLLHMRKNEELHPNQGRSFRYRSLVLRTSYKGLIKPTLQKVYTLEGCSYGENCTFLHDEQSRARESVAISLGPGSVGVYGSNGNGTTLKPSNWKTRICNKWELTGYYPFGSKCHVAHGAAELHRHDGGSLDSDIKDSSTFDIKQRATIYIEMERSL